MSHPDHVFLESRAVGYRLLGADGGVFAFGGASPYEGASEPSSRWVAMSQWATGDGLVVVAEDGSVAFVGPSGFAGPAELPAPAPIVDVATSGRGTGFWILDAAGGVFSFGDAGFHGSIPGLGPDVVTGTAVGMASTPSGLGYWILDANGGIYAFGDAAFHGSVPALRLDVPPAPAVDILATSSGDGYAVLERDGTIRLFGAAATDPLVPVVPCDAVAFAATPSVLPSFLVVDGRGFVHPVGTAPMFGSAAHLQLRAPVVDIAVVCGEAGSAT